MTYPILPAGTVVKPTISIGRFQWMAILSDPGPEHDRTRRVTLQAPRGNRVTVRRDRVRLQSGKLSKFDRILSTDPHRSVVEPVITKPEELGIPDFLKRLSA